MPPEDGQENGCDYSGRRSPVEGGGGGEKSEGKEGADHSTLPSPTHAWANGAEGVEIMLNAPITHARMGEWTGGD